MKNSDSLSRLLSGSGKVMGQNVSRLLASTNLVSGAAEMSNSGTSLLPGAQRDLKALSSLTKPSATSIKFGSPSSSQTSSSGSSASGSGWGSLLGQVSSGSGLSGMLGIDSIISGIASLFGGGGKTAPPALTRFQMPKVQEQTVYVSPQGSSTYEGNAVHTYGPPQSGASPNVDAQWFMDNSAHIAQAVRTAMLNSNSINDVVSEV